jgi:UDP-glucose 4-epimerase
MGGDQMDNYLIIGGNGVIGHFVARRLVKAGHRPVIMSRGGDPALINDILDRCVNLRGDMTDSKTVDDIVRAHGISHIVHLGAALPSVAETNPAAAIRLNAEGTANVLEAAKNNGVKRVVMASTKAVYGPATGQFDAPTYVPVPESKLPEPATMYGISKLASEMLGQWYSMGLNSSRCASAQPSARARSRVTGARSAATASSSSMPCPEYRSG